MDYYFYTTETQNGKVNYLSLLPHEVVYENGLCAETIIGTVTGEPPITVHNFQLNKRFLFYLHSIIVRFIEKNPLYKKQAKKIGDGTLYIKDDRMKNNIKTNTEPADIIASIQVNNKVLALDTYEPNAGYKLITEDGLFQLTPELRKYAIEELTRRSEANLKQQTDL